MVGPAAAILGFTVKTLWYFKTSAPIEVKFSVQKNKKEKKKKVGKKEYYRKGRNADREECGFSVAYQDH